MQTKPILSRDDGGHPLLLERLVGCAPIGAIGVSGVKPDQDAQVARAGNEVLNSLRAFFQ